MGSKMVFYKDYNLLIYSKVVIIALKALLYTKVEEIEESSKSSKSSKSEELDVKEVQRDFQ